MSEILHQIGREVGIGAGVGVSTAAVVDIAARVDMAFHPDEYHELSGNIPLETFLRLPRPEFAFVLNHEFESLYAICFLTMVLVTAAANYIDNK